MSDLGVCEPSSSISPAGVKDHWRLIDYETKTGLSGRMLYSGEEGVPEDISMPLDLKGWHRSMWDLARPIFCVLPRASS